MVDSYFQSSILKLSKGIIESVNDDRTDEYTEKLFELFYHERVKVILKEFHEKIILLLCKVLFRRLNGYQVQPKT
ncbi:hypothetical protein KHA80_14660 [Anaerobacillus sp. HL2]|nr:hypothetical protein KHA80_14660 [Anaerobacillus sp. HL2]